MKDTKKNTADIPKSADDQEQSKLFLEQAKKSKEVSATELAKALKTAVPPKRRKS